MPTKYPLVVLPVTIAFACVWLTPCSCTLTKAETPTTLNRNYNLVEQCLLRHGIAPTQIVRRDTASDSSLYKNLNFQWNTLHGRITPPLYFLPHNEADVSTAVRCCTQTRTRIVPRGGGHSYLKYGFGDADSLVVDLRLMNQVEVAADEKVGSKMVAIVGMGARGGKIQHDLWATSTSPPGGLLLPTGMCPTVGIAGFTLGGGYGYHTLLYGLAVDNVLEMKMVDWTGALLTSNSNQNSDLFWALRGAGSGSFGIVTSMKFKVYHAPRHVVLATAVYDVDHFGRFFKAWQAWITSTPHPPYHMGTFTIITGGTVNMELYCFDQDHDGGRCSVARGKECLATSFPTPDSLTVVQYTYPEWMVSRGQFFSNTTLSSPSDLVNLTEFNKVGWKKVKSIYVKKVIQHDADIAKLAKLVRQFSQWPSLAMGIEQYGGAINKVGRTDTAFLHRKTLYEIQLAIFDSNGENLGAVREMQNFFEATKAESLFGHKQSYQNYLDEDLPDYLERYYGENLERLVAVKRKVDPYNVFHSPMSIPLFA